MQWKISISRTRRWLACRCDWLSMTMTRFAFQHRPRSNVEFYFLCSYFVFTAATAAVAAVKKRRWHQMGCHIRYMSENSSHKRRPRNSDSSFSSSSSRCAHTDRISLSIVLVAVTANKIYLKEHEDENGKKESLIWSLVCSASHIFEHVIRIYIG